MGSIPGGKNTAAPLFSQVSDAKNGLFGELWILKEEGYGDGEGWVGKREKRGTMGDEMERGRGMRSMRKNGLKRGFLGGGGRV